MCRLLKSNIDRIFLLGYTEGGIDMINITSTKYLNLKNGRFNLDKVGVVGDANSRYLKLKIDELGESVKVDLLCKLDDKVYITHAEYIDGNWIVQFPNEVFASEGDVSFQIKISDDESTVFSEVMTTHISKNLVIENMSESIKDTYINFDKLSEISKKDIDLLVDAAVDKKFSTIDLSTFKGEKGDRGEKGEPGEKGEKGEPGASADADIREGFIKTDLVDFFYKVDYYLASKYKIDPTDGFNSISKMKEYIAAKKKENCFYGESLEHFLDYGCDLFLFTCFNPEWGDFYVTAVEYGGVLFDYYTKLKENTLPGKGE